MRSEWRVITDGDVYRVIQIYNLAQKDLSELSDNWHQLHCFFRDKQDAIRAARIWNQDADRDRLRSFRKYCHGDVEATTQRFKEFKERQRAWQEEYFTEFGFTRWWNLVPTRKRKQKLKEKALLKEHRQRMRGPSIFWDTGLE